MVARAIAPEGYGTYFPLVFGVKMGWPVVVGNGYCGKVEGYFDMDALAIGLGIVGFMGGWDKVLPDSNS